MALEEMNLHPSATPKDRGWKSQEEVKWKRQAASLDSIIKVIPPPHVRVCPPVHSPSHGTGGLQPLPFQAHQKPDNGKHRSN